MKEKLQRYCERELAMVRNYHADPQAALTRCYGAVMFVLSESDDIEDIGRWWDDKMLPLFRAEYGVV